MVKLVNKELGLVGLWPYVTENIRDTFFVLTAFDVICDLLLKRPAATRSLFASLRQASVIMVYLPKIDVPNLSLKKEFRINNFA